MLKRPKGALVATLPKATLGSACVPRQPWPSLLSLKSGPLYWPRPSFLFLATSAQRTDPPLGTCKTFSSRLKSRPPNASSALPWSHAPDLPSQFLSSSLPPALAPPPLLPFTCSPAPPGRVHPPRRPLGRGGEQYGGWRGAVSVVVLPERRVGLVCEWARQWAVTAATRGLPNPRPVPSSPPYPCGALCGAWCWPFFYSLFLLGRRKEGE